MKSSVILSANQRVERITPSTLVVGVDIAKERHVAQLCSFRGIVLNKRPIRFENSRVGFEYLVRSIRALQDQHHMDDVVVGMESTGHYFFNLAGYLLEQGIEVVLVNPATTKRNKENRDNTPSKSDPKDAAVIAEVVARGYYHKYNPKDPEYHRLATLCKVRERLVKEQGRAKNRIQRWLDLYFPEFYTVFKDVVSQRALATLHAMPFPSEIAHLSPQEVVQRWIEHGMRRAGGASGIAVATALVKAAANSIGMRDGQDAAQWELACLLEDYERYHARIQESEQLIQAMLEEIPLAETLLTAGLPTNSCAVIVAFGGDLSQYDHGNQLLRRAGLNLAERSSGKYEGKIKLSKRGNSLLRKHLYLAVIHLLRHSPTFRAWHRRNVDVKHMKGMQSVIKLIGKLARIIVAMARNHEPFRPEQPVLNAA